jgi:hypothetical protein
LKKWGPSDYVTLAVDAIEDRFVVTSPRTGRPRSFLSVTSEESRSHGSRAFKGFIDLCGVRTLPNGDYKREVVDWKTTGSIGIEHSNRLRLSWQWKLYGYVYGADTVVYRSIQRDGRVSETRLDWPSTSWYPEDVERFMRQVLDLRESQLGESTWLQHSPFACRAYGRDCPRLDVCARYNQHLTGEAALGPMSYSGAETLLLCPERYRLEQVLGREDGESEGDTSLGTAFHAGAAEAWRQIKALQD